jgi:hypothetical protein
MKWTEFERDARELASLVKGRFEATELILLGTVRRDGRPRISPIEFGLFEGDLMLGGMWHSTKFLDIERDPRCTVHSTTCDKDAPEGDAKLYGTLVPVEPARQERYWTHRGTTRGWRPPGLAHLYAFDVESGAFVKFDRDGTMHWLTWPGPGWRSKSSD